MVTIDLSHEGRRSRTRRRRPARTKTLSRRGMNRERHTSLRVLDDAACDERPRTRAECRDGPRPCLYVSCRFHLYLDVNASGSIKLNHPGLEPWELEESCALDLAERGGLTHEHIARVLNVTRERARQVEAAGLTKVRDALHS